MEYKEQLIELLQQGVQTDGAHHKQWILSECLKLVDPKLHAALKSMGYLDEGMAP